MATATKTKRGRPSLAELADRVGTREGILQAARSLMITNNSADFSLSEIARMTGQSPALVQYHFGSKEGLLMAVIEIDAAKAVRELKALDAADLPVLTKMRLHIEGIVNAYFEAPYANRLLHTLTQNCGPAIAQQVSDIFLRPIADFQRKLLAQGQDAGVFGDVDPMNFHFILLGSCDHFFSRQGMLAHVFGKQEITPELKNAYAKTLANIVLSGILA